MKKSIFAMAGLALVFASCSNDEMLDKAVAPQQAISFKTVVDKNTRGVTDLHLGTDPTFTSFKVWGYESSSNDYENVVTRFNGVQVTKNGSDWEYNDPQYWTIGNYYWFCGYRAVNSSAAYFAVNDNFVESNASAWPGASVTTSTNPLFGGTMYFNNGSAEWSPAGLTDVELTGSAGDSDLVYAWWKPSGAIDRTDIPTVDFAFKHILSKVAFKFVNEMEYSTLKITALKVNGVPYQGTLNMSVASPSWTGEGSYTMDYARATGSDITALASIAPGANATSLFRIFIPADFTYNITFTVELYQGTPATKIATYNHTVSVSGLTLEMGKAYTLTATLNKNNIDPLGALNKIEFNPTVNNWVPDNSNNITFPTSGSNP